MSSIGVHTFHSENGVPSVVKGGGRQTPISREEGHEVPIISWDNMEQKTNEGTCEESDTTNKTLVGIDR